MLATIKRKLTGCRFKAHLLLSFTIVGFVLASSLFLQTNGLFIEEDLKVWGCLDGWIGNISKLVMTAKQMNECGSDPTTTPECKRHCLTKKLGLIMEGRIWVYKLVVTIRTFYPGPVGKESVDKATDIVLECSDRHYKSLGALSQYHCYREKRMWYCVITALGTICDAKRRKEEGNDNNNERKQHRDILIHEGRHIHPHPAGGGEQFEPTGKRQIVLTDY